MKWHQDNDSTQWKFSQSLSSSKHIILSVVTYKLYLQQQQKTTKKILNMKTRIQHVNSPSTSEENFLSQTSDQNTPHQGSRTIQYRNIKSESSSSIPCGTKRSSKILLDRCRCSCLFQACLYNKSYLPDFFPPLSTTLNSLLSSVINSSLLLYYGILLPLLMFSRTMWFFSLLISAFFSLLHLIPCTLPGFFFL